jgi:hypothetical protein
MGGKRLPLGKIKMKSGVQVVFEVSEQVPGRVSKDGVAAKLERNFEDIMNVVKETAESAYEGLQNIEKIARPNEYEMTFGLKLSANAGVIFAQAGTEGSFQVTLRWTT